MCQGEVTNLEKTLLRFILLLYLVVAGLFAVYVPEWQAPDEPAHYNYIAQVADSRVIPVIEPGDWDQAYLSTLTGNRFAPDSLDALHTLQYEDHQPPLYYLLAAPVYALTGGSLLALRLVSVALGLIIVWSAYATGRVIFPLRPWIALSAAAFVAFLPQHVHILASVNNDALGWAVVGVTLLFTVAYVKGERLGGHTVKPWQLGVLVGIGFCAKTTTYFMAGVVLAAVFLRRWTIHRRDIRDTAEFSFPEEVQTDTWTLNPILRHLVLFFIPALILGGVWWGRNLVVYGVPDFLGLGAHDAVVVGQPRTADRIADLGTAGYLKEFSQTTFNSFWGQFGWMAVPMPSYLYILLKAFTVIALGGIALELLFRRRHAPETHDDQQNVWWVLRLVAVFSILAYFFYNTAFQQYQGRYLFTMLIPLGLWFALGVDAWRRVTTASITKDRSLNPSGRFSRMAPYGGVLVFMSFALLDLYLLWRVIVPNL